MRTGERFPDNQAEIVFNDVFIESLAERSEAERLSVMADVLALCDNPVGTHPLSNKSATDRLAGWNTLDVLAKEYRVIFASGVQNGVGVIEVLCIGPRRADAAYDMANALIATGRLSNDDVTEIWQALTLLDVLAEQIGLDGWDYLPPPAPAGMVKTAVAAGLLDESTAALLSKDELQAALEGGWGDAGADPVAALRAALSRARGGVDLADLTRIIAGRGADRCGVVLPRAGVLCIRRAGHPGPHRAHG